MAKAAAVLNLDTLVERPIVIVNGQEYEMLNPSELTVLDFFRIGKQGNRIQELLSAPAMDEPEIAEVCRLTDEMCRFVLHAPPEIHTSFSDTQRLKIISTFTTLQEKIGKTPTEPTVQPEVEPTPVVKNVQLPEEVTEAKAEPEPEPEPESQSPTPSTGE